MHRSTVVAHANAMIDFHVQRFTRGQGREDALHLADIYSKGIPTLLRSNDGLARDIRLAALRLPCQSTTSPKVPGGHATHMEEMPPEGGIRVLRILRRRNKDDRRRSRAKSM